MKSFIELFIKHPLSLSELKKDEVEVQDAFFWRKYFKTYSKYLTMVPKDTVCVLFCGNILVFKEFIILLSLMIGREPVCNFQQQYHSQKTSKMNWSCVVIFTSASFLTVNFSWPLMLFSKVKKYNDLGVDKYHFFTALPPK